MRNELKLERVKRVIRVTFNDELVGSFDSKKSKESFKRKLKGVYFHGDDTLKLVQIGLKIDCNGGYREFILYVPKNTDIVTNF